MSHARGRNARLSVKFAGQRDAEIYVARELVEVVPPAAARLLAAQFLLFCDGSLAAVDWPEPDDAETTFGGEDEWSPRGWTILESELSELKAIAVVVWCFATNRDDVEKLVSLTLGAFLAWLKLRRNGVTLDAPRQVVLLALRKHGPLSEGGLLAAVRALGYTGSRGDVQSLLVALSKTRLRNGRVVALVHQAADGRWSTDAHGLWELPWGAIG